MRYRLIGLDNAVVAEGSFGHPGYHPQVLFWGDRVFLPDGSVPQPESPSDDVPSTWREARAYSIPRH